jgi:polysaccharide biosynthesis transport protein
VSVTQSLPLRELLRVLYRRRSLIILVTLLGTGMVSLGALLLPPRYTAKSQIVVSPQPNSVTGSPAFLVAPDDAATIMTEVTKISSQGYLQQVLSSLSRDPPKPMPTASRATFAGELRNTLLGWLPESLRVTPHNTQSDLEAFVRNLNISQEHGSHVITISFTSASPSEAMTAANRVAGLYVKTQNEEKLADSDRVLAWLDKRIPELRGEVERLQVAIRDYKSTNGLVDRNPAGVTDQQLADLNHQLAAAQSDLSMRQARLDRLREQKRHGTSASAFVGIPELPALSDLRHQELTLLQAQAQVAVTMGEKHPKMQQLANEIGEVRAKIAAEVDRAIDSAAGDVQVATAEVQDIQRRIASVQSINTDPRLDALEHDALSNQRIYEQLQQRREELREQRELISAGVTVLSLASLPDRPSSTNPILFIPPAFIAFLVCGCFLATMRDRLDIKLRSESDIHDALAIPCLGLVPRLRRVRRRRPHQYLTSQPFAPYTEAIRSIVAALGLVDARTAPKVVLLSSSLPQEGKTTLAVSLAAYAAFLGRRTILVDLDFRHPAVLRELTENTRGGSELLPVEALGPDPILHSESLNLDYLALPRDGADPLVRFAGDHISRLLIRLRATYDCVIIDSAPLLAITETRLLSSLADKILFVVKWGATSRDVAQNALRVLNGSEARWKAQPGIVGAVITQVDLRKHARYRYGDAGEFLAQYGNSYLIDESRGTLGTASERIHRRSLGKT